MSFVSLASFGPYDRVARGAAIVACAILGSIACRSSASLSPARPASADARLEQLQRDVDAILTQPALARGYWGVLVKSLRSGATIYTLNARKLMMPASTLKLVTLAAAADRLGWDYTYATRFFTAGRVENGVLAGDVVVAGTGDPSFGTADDPPGRAFDACAEGLRALGVRTILGRIIGDDHAFDNDGLGFGWSWDDLPDDYAAGVSALQFNENAVRVTVAPGPAAGDVAGVMAVPADSGLTIDNRVQTAPEGSIPAIEARRLPGSARLELRGTIPLRSAAVTRVVSVDNPTLFFAKALRSGLIARGLDVRGAAVDIDDMADPPPLDRRVEFAAHRSRPLSALAVRLMKTSQNLYAETLLKAIGAADGTPTALAGRMRAEAVLHNWGVAPESMILRDGSGLSRYNYVSPEALVTILTHVAGDDRLRGPFEAALPVAGRDGTLATRMKGTAAEGNVRAKTGSMTNVRALSGYATTLAGEPLVFAIIANNSEVAPSVVTDAIDAVVVRLVKGT